MHEVIVPLGVVGFVTMMLGLVTRLFSNLSLNRTLREALRSDPGSVPVLAERLDARQPWADELIGWIILAFALGLVLMGLFEEPVEQREVFQAAIIPAVMGLVAIGYVRWAKRSR